MYNWMIQQDPYEHIPYSHLPSNVLPSNQAQYQRTRVSYPKSHQSRERNGKKEMRGNEPWTKEEDDLLEQKFNEMGPHWAKMAAFFPGRTDVNLKNRWSSLLVRKSKEEFEHKHDDFLDTGENEQTANPIDEIFDIRHANELEQAIKDLEWENTLNETI